MTTGRVMLRYTGADEVSFAGSVHASPRWVGAGGTVTVDAWAAPIMLEGGLFEAADEGQAGAMDALNLRGAALEDALREADLPTTGTADEKRARLADYRSNPEHEEN